MSPPQVMRPGQLPAAQLMRVSFVAPLSIKFWQACSPLHSMRQALVVAPQLTFPGQLPGPSQRSAQSSASQRSSFMQDPCLVQRTSHDEPLQVTLPAQLFSAAQLMTQAVES
jgi:hypothetical protein